MSYHRHRMSYHRPKNSRHQAALCYPDLVEQTPLRAAFHRRLEQLQDSGWAYARLDYQRVQLDCSGSVWYWWLWLAPEWKNWAARQL
jgi:hypothetical protein